MWAAICWLARSETWNHAAILAMSCSADRVCLQADLENSLAAARKAGSEASSSAETWRTSAETQQAAFAARLKQLNMQAWQPLLDAGDCCSYARMLHLCTGITNMLDGCLSA